jgi:ethanolamine utilization protein EutQ
MQTPETPQRIGFDSLVFAPRFEHGDQARIAVVSGPEDATALGTGFARFAQADFAWTVRYDEMLLVVEGRLTVRTGAGDLDAGPRDCVWLPKGTALRYIAENALVFYAIHPANWAEAAS